MLDRFLAGQFARPQGAVGQFLVAPLLNWIGAPMMDAAFDALEAKAGEAVLDLGIGGGQLADRLLRTGVLLSGVDPSGAVLARANRRQAQRVKAGQARFLEGAAEALPLPSSAFDKAASVNTLYFWEDLDTALAELARVIRPGGRLVLGFQTAEAVRAWPGHVHGFRAWDEPDVTAATEAAGFAICELRAGHHRRVRGYRTLIALRD